MRQNVKRRARNYPVRSELKTYFKKELLLIKDGKTDEAVKLMPKVFSIIDMACKKNILHQNNAARKKSRIAKALNELQSKGSSKKKDADTTEKVAEAEDSK